MGASTAGAVHLDLGLHIHVWLFAVPLDLMIDVLLFSCAGALNPTLWGIWLRWL